MTKLLVLLFGKLTEGLEFYKKKVFPPLNQN